MFIGKNKETNELVEIKKALDMPDATFVCPICGEDLIIKNGSVVAPHFAHKSGHDCDTFTHDMSEWHKWWQALFPVKNREHIEELTISLKDYEEASYKYNFRRKATIDFIRWNRNKETVTLKHRADVRACGYIIEFQNSPISREEFNERNWFYNKIGCKVVWVFNFMQESFNRHLEFYSEVDSDYGGSKYKWRYPIKTFRDFLPQYNKRHYIPTGELSDSKVLLFFQLAECDDYNIEYGIMEQVVWALTETYKLASFKWFITSYKVANPKELYNAVIHKQL